VATANGVSCATTTTCATLTVNPTSHITLTLAAGSAVFAAVSVTAIDPATGEVEGPFEVPIGAAQTVEAGSYRLVFTPPAGYTVTPAQADFSLQVGSDFTVTLRFDPVDTTPPVLIVSTDLRAEATSSAGARVTFAAPTATDAGSGVASVSCDRAPGDVFSMGMTRVQCSATDNAGHTASATFTVTVQDTRPPTIALPANMTVDATSPEGALVSYATSATDSVSGAVVVRCTPASGSMLPIGTSTVTCTAVDAAGNSVGGSFHVLVQAAAAQVSHLALIVQGFNLAQGIENSLDTKLQNVLSALNAARNGSVGSVCSQLNAFINETTAQSAKKLTVAQANQLIAAAQQIQAVIGCQ
jgi:hypothetical protein